MLPSQRLRDDPFEAQTVSILTFVNPMLPMQKSTEPDIFRMLLSIKNKNDDLNLMLAKKPVP